MLGLYLDFIIGLCLVSLKFRGVHSEYNFPWSRAKPCNCDRLTPISLVSAQTKPVHVSEMVISISEDAEFEFVNDVFVQGTLTKGSGTLTGGPFFNDTYELTTALYRVDGVFEHTRASGLRDGKGSPISEDIVFQKSGLTTEEAYESPDGFVIISFPVDVEGNIDNPKFEPYGRILRSTTQPNATTSSRARDFLPWLFDALHHNCYFAFPGSRVRPPLLYELHPASIWIVPSSRIQTIISYRQYQEYLGIMNSAGQPLLLPAPCYKQGNRTVVEICDPVKVIYEKC